MKTSLQAEGWPRVPLEVAADVAWGDTSVTKSSYVTNGYPAYSASGRDGFLPYFDYAIPGVVVSAIGAQCGKAWFASGEWSCIKNTIRILGRPGISDPRFLYYATSRPGIFPTRGSAQPFIAQSDARAVEISLPPLEDQIAISSALGLLDDKSESDRRIVAIAGELLNAMAVLAAEDLPRLPLGTFATLNSSKVDPLRLGEALTHHYSLPAYDAGAVPEVTQAHAIKSTKISMRRPAILLSRLNPRIDRTWWTHLQPEVPALASTEFACLEAETEKSLAGVWLAVRDPTFRAEMLRRVTGTSGSHQRVRQEDLLDIEVVDVHQVADEVLDLALSLLTLTWVLRLQITRLAALRDTLMPELLSGRLQVSGNATVA